MNTVLKITALAAAIGIVVWLIKSGKDLADQVAVKIASVGKATLNNGKLTVPLTISITNPAPVSVPIDTIAAKIYLFKSGMWVPLGTLNPTGPLQINPGNNNVPLYPVIDVSVLNPFTSPGSVISQVTTLLQNQSAAIAQIKIAVTVTIKGIDIEQVQTSSISLSDLKNAA